MTTMQRSPLTPIPSLATGLAFGVFVLHPAAMLFRCVGGSTWGERLGHAFLGSFGEGMGGMLLLFAVLGTGLAALSQLPARPRRAHRPARRRPPSPLRRLCLFCKAMPHPGADGEEHWLPLEQVLYQESGVEFRHGVCPRCRPRVVGPTTTASRGLDGPASPGSPEGPATA